MKSSEVFSCPAWVVRDFSGGLRGFLVARASCGAKLGPSIEALAAQHELLCPSGRRSQDDRRGGSGATCEVPRMTWRPFFEACAALTQRPG